MITLALTLLAVAAYVVAMNVGVAYPRATRRPRRRT